MKTKDEIIAEMRWALGKALESMGWRGVGPNDRNDFYCEFCKATNEDSDLIPHFEACPILGFRKALALSTSPIPEAGECLQDSEPRRENTVYKDVNTPASPLTDQEREALAESDRCALERKHAHWGRDKQRIMILAACVRRIAGEKKG